MAGDASGKTLSLLDALDKSFTSSGSPDSSFLLNTPETPHGSQNGSQTQQSSITDYFEPGSSSKKNTTAELLRAAQARAAGVASAGWFLHFFPQETPTNMFQQRSMRGSYRDLLDRRRRGEVLGAST